MQPTVPGDPKIISVACVLCNKKGLVYNGSRDCNSSINVSFGSWIYISFPWISLKL